MKGSDIVNLVISKLEEQSAFLHGDNATNPILSGNDNLDEMKPVYSYINTHLEEAANEILYVAPLNRLTPTDGKEYTSVTRNAGSESWYREAIEGDDGTGKILLPPDFCRLYSLKMNGWSRPVHTAITKDSNIYTLQSNRYTKGTPQKPVVVFSGNRVVLDDMVSSVGNNALHHILYDNKNVVKKTKAYYTTASSDVVAERSTAIIGNSDVFIAIIKSGKAYKYTLITTATPNYWNDGVEITLPYLEYYSVSQDKHEIEEFLYIPFFDRDADYNRDIAEAIALNCAKKVMEIYGETEKVNTMTAELTGVLQNMQIN